MGSVKIPVLRHIFPCCRSHYCSVVLRNQARNRVAWKEGVKCTCCWGGRDTSRRDVQPLLRPSSSSSCHSQAWWDPQRQEEGAGTSQHRRWHHRHHQPPLCLSSVSSSTRSTVTLLYVHDVLFYSNCNVSLCFVTFSWHFLYVPHVCVRMLHWLKCVILTMFSFQFHPSVRTKATADKEPWRNESDALQDR